MDQASLDDFSCRTPQWLAVHEHLAFYTKLVQSKHCAECSCHYLAWTATDSSFLEVEACLVIANDDVPRARDCKIHFTFDSAGQCIAATATLDPNLTTLTISDWNLTGSINSKGFCCLKLLGYTLTLQTPPETDIPQRRANTQSFCKLHRFTYTNSFHDSTFNIRPRLSATATIFLAGRYPVAGPEDADLIFLKRPSP